MPRRAALTADLDGVMAPSERQAIKAAALFSGEVGPKRSTTGLTGVKSLLVILFSEIRFQVATSNTKKESARTSDRAW